MNEFLIKQYVNNITIDDIKTFANSYGIVLNELEANIIFKHIKDDWRTVLYGNPRVLLDDIKNQVEPITYNKIEELYISFKDKIHNYL